MHWHWPVTVNVCGFVLTFVFRMSFNAPQHPALLVREQRGSAQSASFLCINKSVSSQCPWTTLFAHHTPPRLIVLALEKTEGSGDSGCSCEAAVQSPLGWGLGVWETLETDMSSSLSPQKLANSKAHTSRFISANLPCNKFKNRLVNIMPFESTRVCLQPIRGVEGSDYINASFIDGYRWVHRNHVNVEHKNWKTKKNLKNGLGMAELCYTESSLHLYL